VRSRLRLVTTCLLALGLAFAFTAGSTPQQPDLYESADLKLFKPGNIISDGVFYDTSTMTRAQIQEHLTVKGNRCTANCLKDHREDTWTRPADSRCKGYTGAVGETAAQIISKVSRSCGINPQVLIVMLQKEQGLVTGTPTSTSYRSAMGFGCPDTRACDTQYYGFFNQLYSAANQLQRYRANPGNYKYRAGMTNTISYHPATAKANNLDNWRCGTAQVYIQNQATAALYIYTPYVPNAAALANPYGEGDSCSAYGNRNFFRYFVDWFGSTQSSGGSSVLVKYDQLKAAGVDLGEDTSEVTCNLAGGGCYRSYQGGTIFWSRYTGAHVVRGAILQRYLSLGGVSLLGYPTGDDTAAPFGTGYFTDFQGGAIYWSSATGAREVRGDLLATWRAKGAQAGVLGYPVGGDEAVPGGFRTRFQGGTLYWSAPTGARMVRGALLERYEAAGGPRVLGFPKADERAAAGGGAKVELQGGAIYWSSATGAHVVRGDILAKWRQRGAESGALGYPTGDDQAVASGYRTVFQKGAVYWSSRTGARVMGQAISQRYSAHGGPRVLGFPTTDQVAAAGGGAKVELQGGAIYWSSATGAHVVRGDILAKWRQWGAESGALGYPTGDDAAAPGGGYLTTFRGGTIWWSKATGAKVMRGAILERYVAHGGPRVLGYPKTDDVPAAGGGAKVELQGGAIYWSSATGAHVVRGEILARWRQLGAETGRLGYPSGDDTAVPGGYRTDFRGGTIWWSPKTGPRVVESPAAKAYADLGGPTSYLGFPTRDTRTVAGGRRTDFQGGYLLVTADGKVSAHRT
jgi:uncharacterized protein with LGFP repeats